MDTTYAHLRQTQQSSRSLAILDDATRNAVLHTLAELTLEAIPALLAENKRDTDRMNPADPRYDRLLLTEARLRAIANDVRTVAHLPTPLDIVLEERTLPNDLHLQKVSVPMGVIGVVYEARPNVTFDVFALCFKAGSACVLKGGSDAQYSNAAIMAIVHRALEQHGLKRSLAWA
jgi:glutamate-5-semialdehyde dehydrogenase